MRFRGLTPSGDWTFGKGLQSYAKENYAIMLDILTFLKTFYGECFFNRDWGVPWFDLLGSKDQTALIYTLRNEILKRYGVVGLTNVEFRLDSNRQLNVTYQISTIYSVNVTGSVTL
jgi:hypothetical protein